MGQRLVGTAFDGLVELPAEHDLETVDAYITSQCNRRCTYCFLPSDFFSSGLRMSAEALHRSRFFTEGQILWLPPER